jgi:hypothetical protein
MRWACLIINAVLFVFPISLIIHGKDIDLAFAVAALIIGNTMALTEFDPVVPLKCVRLYFHRKKLEEEARIAELKKSS